MLGVLGKGFKKVRLYSGLDAVRKQGNSIDYLHNSYQRDRKSEVRLNM